MIKASTLLTRRDGMSPAEFQTYWRDTHGPLTARVPGLRRYIQCHSLLETYESESPPDYDGVSETWWDSVEAYERAQDSPEYQAALADEANFAANREVILSREIALKDDYPTPAERADMVKFMAMLFVKDGVGLEDFQRHWKDVHGALHLEMLLALRRYVQSHVLLEAFDADGSRYGGLPEAWFDDVDGLNKRPEGEALRRDTEWRNFCSGQRALFAREVVIVE